MIRLIVAVGNPGTKYAQTRHNVGWQFLDHHPDFKSVDWKEKFKSLYTDLVLNSEKIYLQKPQTFMNLSGEAVGPLMNFFKIQPSELMVIHDELDLPLGQVQFRVGGGLAGHNGLKSIVQHIGTDDFARLRIGIGRPQFGSVSDWVLSNFSDDEKIRLQNIFLKLSLGLIECMKSGVNSVSMKYNKKDLS